jgi:NAD(P)-dependent dehydrogenase (short-subunit alcohol dehydrogenase family)
VDLRVLADTVLEITIVGSFTHPGYAARRRLFGWTDPAPGSLSGRTVLVTGPTSGLGRAATVALADLGARVVLVGRSADRLAGIRDELVARHGEDRFPVVRADLSVRADVHRAVDAILASEARLDVLVDNAGAIHETRVLTSDGLESTFATMVVNPFILVSGLLPLLRESGDGRVIAVTSGGMYFQRLRLDDLQSASGTFSGTLAYARAKRAQTALIREWARRLAGERVRFNAMHPGWADTPGLATLLPGFHRLMRPLLRTPAQGADTIVWLAADPRAGSVGGQLFLDRRPRPFDRLPATVLGAADRRRLWDAVVSLSGGLDPAPDPRRRAG